MKRFLDFVEIQTKLATFFPFLLALAYAFYTTGTINLYSTLIYIPAALLIDMSITAINNHFNHREEGREPHYSHKAGLVIICLMILISAAIGLYLVYLHGVVLLMAGGLCFVVGICYTLGPMPISKSVFGEAFAGVFAAGMVMFIVLTINDPAFLPVSLTYISGDIRLTIDINIRQLLSFALVALPATLCVSNILLANNICDEEADRSFRYTLVHHIGSQKALRLFAVLYCGAYLAIVAASLLGLLPLWCLLTLLTAIPVQKNVRIFLDKQVKSETFVLSVKNFTLIAMALTFCIFIGGILK